MEGILIVIIIIVVAFIIGYCIGKGKTEEVKDAALKKSRAVLGGQFSEQLAPYLPDFPYSPTEVRFIGKPIDFIVFKGMDMKNINEVVFVEVKSGKSSLSSQEKYLREAILNKNVKWEEYRIPTDVTRRR